MYRYKYYSCNSTSTITDIIREYVQAKSNKHLKCTLCVEGGPPAALKNDNRCSFPIIDYIIELDIMNEYKSLVESASAAQCMGVQATRGCGGYMSDMRPVDAVQQYHVDD